MKKLILLLLAFAFVAGSVQAQEEALKALKTATRSMSSFRLDPTKKDKLKEAVDNIEVALKDETVQADVKAWLTQGEIYNEIISQTVQVRQLGLGSIDDLPKTENPALKAYNAYLKAKAIAVKKGETKKAIAGLEATQGNLYNMGLYAYEDKEYAAAYDHFKAGLDVHEILKAEDKSNVKTDEQLNEQKYVTALAAMNSDKPAEAALYFEQLYQAKYPNPVIYEALYTLTADKDINEAYKYLEAGRAAYPDELSILFTEINHFLRIDNLDALIGKLKTAIEKEPTNVSLYSTLGSVYDNLHAKASEAGEADKAKANFDSALDYYNQALALKADHFDAIYSIGALYYNKGVGFMGAANKISGYSAADRKQFDGLKKQALAEFDTALPYFQKAEGLNPNDNNTLIALKEIYARKDDFTMSKEFQARYETVAGGGKNEASYFKK